MKIKTVINQHRRDFEALYVCEGCGHEKKGDGYDDANFHNNVIPGLICPKCKESTVSLGAKIEPRANKYAAHEVV